MRRYNEEGGGGDGGDDGGTCLQSWRWAFKTKLPGMRQRNALLSKNKGLWGGGGMVMHTVVSDHCARVSSRCGDRSVCRLRRQTHAVVHKNGASFPSSSLHCYANEYPPFVDFGIPGHQKFRNFEQARLRLYTSTAARDCNRSGHADEEPAARGQQTRPFVLDTPSLKYHKHNARTTVLFYNWAFLP